MRSPDNRLSLSTDCVLRSLEVPSLYNIKTDTLYELDGEGFSFLAAIAGDEASASPDPEFLDFCIAEAILVEGGEPYNRPIHKGPVLTPSLRYLELLITEKCNLKCGHCYLGEAGPGELSLDRLFSAVSDFTEAGGLRLLIAGGEPMLHSGFNELNARLPELGLRSVLLTNGTLIGDIDKARALNFHEVQVSVDGLRPGHDFIRGKGSFDKAIEAIRHLKAAGKTTSVATMIHGGNIKEFAEMKSFFSKLGVNSWQVDAPSEAGFLEADKGLLVSPEEAARAFNYGFGMAGHHGPGSPGYACGSHLMNLNFTGDYCRCGFFTDEPLGSVEEGIVKSWKALHHWRLDELSSECRACEFLEECRGGCRFRALKVEGDLMAVDSIFCHAFGVKNPSKERD